MVGNSLDTNEDRNQTVKKDAIDEVLAKKEMLYRRQKIIFVLSVIAFIAVLAHIIIDVFLQNPHLP